MTERERIFTPDEVVKLNSFQVEPGFHAFTCPDRGDGKHRAFNGDLGGLVATVHGWICPFCDYHQTWAHAFMKGERVDINAG